MANYSIAAESQIKLKKHMITCRIEHPSFSTCNYPTLSSIRDAEFARRDCNRTIANHE